MNVNQFVEVGDRILEIDSVLMLRRHVEPQFVTIPERITYWMVLRGHEKPFEITREQYEALKKLLLPLENQV